MKKYLNKIEKSSKKLTDLYKKTFSETIESLDSMVEDFKSSTQFKDAKFVGTIDGDDEGGLSYGFLLEVSRACYLSEDDNDFESLKKFKPTKSEIEKMETIVKTIKVVSKSSIFKEIVEHYE